MKWSAFTIPHINQMQWHRRLRWKLFLSHMMVGVVAVVMVLATATVLANISLVHDILRPYTSVVDSRPTDPDVILEGQLVRRFELVMREALFVAAVSALIAAVLISLAVSLRIVEPLQAITGVSRRLAQGFYRERTVINSDDELAELCRSVNQLAEALQQTEQRRLALLADVAHELRTPISTIGGYMEGMIDGVIQPDNQTFTLVLHESRRLQRLIEDLMLLSRVEAGQVRIAPHWIDLRQTLHDLLIRFEPQSVVRDIKLRLQLPDQLPPVWADIDRVDQIFINLITNALRYTPNGGSITIRAFVGEEYAVIIVEDTGIGIAPEHLPHLFERFYRVDKSRSRTSGGSGIGLTIAHHLAYAQGGDIWAESDGRGRGSRFVVTLPLSPPNPSTHPPKSHTTESEHPLKRLEIA